MEPISISLCTAETPTLKTVIKVMEHYAQCGELYNEVKDCMDQNREEILIHIQSGDGTRDEILTHVVTSRIMHMFNGMINELKKTKKEGDKRLSKATSLMALLKVMAEAADMADAGKDQKEEGAESE